MAFPSIKINIGMDTGKLARDARKSEGIVKSFGRTASHAMTGFAVAAGAAAVAIGVDGVKAAIEDEAAQVKLAKTLENTTKATAAQVKQVEDYITATQNATGVMDDDLRPSLDRLVRSTGNVKKAMELQQIALNVSAGTGKDLQSVTNAIAKAYDGNFGALKRLGVPLSDAIVKSKDFSKVQQVLAATFSGQMDASLKTHEGQLRVLSARWADVKEQIGYALLDGMKPLMEWVNGPEGQKFMNDFMLSFKDAAKSVAEALPGILDSLKRIGKTAGNLGLDFETLMTPEVMAAGAAWRITPGGAQAKGLAALAAYAGEKASIAGEAQQDMGFWQKDIWGKLNSVWETTTSNTPWGIYQDWANGTNNSIMAQKYGENGWLGFRKPGVDNSLTIIVNGAVDPTATATAINRQIQRAKTQKIANTSVAMGW